MQANVNAYGFLHIKAAIVDAKYDIYVQDCSRKTTLLGFTKCQSYSLGCIIRSITILCVFWHHCVNS